MVERTPAWLTRGSNRKLAYRGVNRNQLWWAHRCAAINHLTPTATGPKRFSKRLTGTSLAALMQRH